jgi:hypothetical protein
MLPHFRALPWLKSNPRPVCANNGFFLVQARLGDFGGGVVRSIVPVYTPGMSNWLDEGDE